MRTAILWLHRKVTGERKCVCGSTLDLIKADGLEQNDVWNCKKQKLLNEPKSIDIKITNKKLFNGKQIEKIYNTKKCKPKIKLIYKND